MNRNQAKESVAINSPSLGSSASMPELQRKHEDLHAAVEGMSAINQHLADLLAKIRGGDAEEFYMIPDRMAGITLSDVLNGDAELLRSHESAAHDLINKIEEVLF